MNVGRSHIAATVNTLVLAYVGDSLPLIVLFAAGHQDPFLNSSQEIVAVEIIRALVGSIGIVAAVPITTAVAVMLAGRTLPSSATARAVAWHPGGTDRDGPAPGHRQRGPGPHRMGGGTSIEPTGASGSWPAGDAAGGIVRWNSSQPARTRQVASRSHMALRARTTVIARSMRRGPPGDPGGPR